MPVLDLTLFHDLESIDGGLRLIRERAVREATQSQEHPHTEWQEEFARWMEGYNSIFAQTAVMWAEGANNVANEYHNATQQEIFSELETWKPVVDFLNRVLPATEAIAVVLRDFPQHFPPRDKQLALVETSLEQGFRFLRVLLVFLPELGDRLSASVFQQALQYRIPWWAYLRSMWNLLWSAILHPLSETTIDLSTGHVLYRT